MAEDLSRNKNKFCTLCDSLAKLAATNIPTSNEILRIRDELNRYSEVENLYYDIYTQVDDLTPGIVSPISIEDLQQTFDTYVNHYYTLKSKYANSNSLITKNDSVNATNYTDDGLKLDHISLPSFSGNDLTEWIGFSEMFTSLVIDNQKLCDVKRLYYLRSCLSCEALRMIQHLPLMAINFPVAWDILKDRYSNKRHLATLHYRQIANATMNNSSVKSLTNFLDVIVNNVNALNALDFPTQQWSFLLLNIILDKLDAETRRQFELNNRSKIPTYDELISYLRNRANALQTAVGTSFSTATAPRLPSHSHSQPRGHGTTRSPLQQSQAHSPSAQSRVPKQHITLSTVRFPRPCSLCNESHVLSKCPVFIELNPTNRLSKVKELKVCINCLATDHFLKDCKSTYSCKTCSSNKHHSLLHIDFSNDNKNISQDLRQLLSTTSSRAFPVQAKDSTVTTPSDNTNVGCYATSLENNKSQILLATVLLNVRDSQGQLREARALIDTGSQFSFITEDFAKQLGLPRRKVATTVHGISGLALQLEDGVVDLNVSSRVGNKQIKMQAQCIPNITGNLPAEPLPISLWPHVVNLTLADPTFGIPSHVSLLLGADVYREIIVGGLVVGPPGTPVCLETIFGWSLMGHTFVQPNRSVFSSHISVARRDCYSLHCKHDAYLDDIVQKFWLCEEPPSREVLSPDDQKCEDIFRNTVTRENDGRYVVSLPFKDYPPDLGDSREIALRQFYSLEKRFKRDPSYKSDYNNFMTDYLNNGYMFPATDNSSSGYYLPHHAVIRDTSSTTRLRVVFNGSCRSDNGNSLNDTLYPGQKLHKEIFDVLSLFRLGEVALVADIKQMFLNINLNPDHQKYQKILWRFDDEPIRDYILTTVTFGLTCSPYLAIRTLNELAHEYADTHSNASRVLLESTFVDDVTCNAPNVHSARSLVAELNSLLAAGGFTLRKWATNRPECLADVPEENKQSLDDCFSPDTTSYLKVLGLQWCPRTDSFSYKIKQTDLVTTKRGILSDLARVFDPLGFISPVVFLAKLLIQKLWILQVGWDDPIPDDLLQEWISIKSNLHLLEQISIPRFVDTPNSADSYVEMHGFADASQLGYGIVTYLRIVKPNAISVHLICAKSRVASIKTVSVPRLELCAAVLLAQVMSHLLKLFSSKVPICKYTCWTDSLITLHWLKAHASKWKTFVSNRVSAIQDHTAPECWRHVRSQDNPADAASRGLPPADLVSHPLWWHGPTFLSGPDRNWPSQPADVFALDEKIVKNLESRQKVETQVLLTTDKTDNDQNEIVDLISKFSHLTKLTRVVAYCFRFGSPTHRSLLDSYPYLTTRELDHALKVCIKVTQAQYFAEDIARLKKEKLPSNTLRKLSPYIDDEGIVRVGGRLQASNLLFENRHPIILPRDSPLTTLIVRYYHVIFGHPGSNALLSMLQSRYWILSARRVVRTVTFRCSQCYKLKPRLIHQIMGRLPPPRIQQIKPYAKTAVDYAGPFLLKTSRLRKASKEKCYIAAFVCMSTKACHLELVSELTTEAFIAALQRFTSRRGRCSDLYSDQGRNFIGCNNELRRIVKNHAHDCLIQDFCSTQNIQFHFQPPNSPHFGGLFESLVKQVKTHLYRIIGSHSLTFEDFYTVLTRVEACLNSRPLVPLSSNPNDFSALTPAHFLTMEPLTAIPEPDLRDVYMPTLKRWNLIQAIHQSFWQRWHREYLHTLQTRAKWHVPIKDIAIGTLVVLKDDDLAPLCWPLGRIVSATPGPDGLVRVVEVRTARGLYKRSVTKIAPLPYVEE